MLSNNPTLKPGNNTNPSSTLKSNTTGNKKKPTNLSTNVNKITNDPNGLVNKKTKCNETLKVNFKSTKTSNDESKTPNNSEGKMACIIS